MTVLYTNKFQAQQLGSGSLFGGKPNLSEADTLLELARMKGGNVAAVAEELTHPEKSILATVGEKFKNGFGSFIDIISKPSQIMAGVLSQDLTISEAIKEKAKVSDIVWGDLDPNANTLSKVGNFTVRFATDVLTDPITYLTFGAGYGFLGLRALPKITLGEKAAATIGKQALTSRALSKEGFEVFSYLKKVSNQKKGADLAPELTGIAAKADSAFSMGRTELETLLKNTIDAPLNTDFTKRAMRNLLEKHPALTETLLDKGGIKFFGQQILAGQRISSAIQMVPGFKLIDHATQNTRRALAAPFSRSLIKVDGKWQRLPEEFLEAETKMRDLAKNFGDDRLTELNNIVKANKLTNAEGQFLMASVEARRLPTDMRLANAYRQLLRFNDDEFEYLKRMGVSIDRMENHAPHVLSSLSVKNIGNILPPKTTIGAASKRRIQDTIFTKDTSKLSKLEKAVLSKNQQLIDDTIIGMKNSGMDIFDDNLVSAHVQRTNQNIKELTSRQFIRDVAEEFGQLETLAPRGWRAIDTKNINKEVESLWGVVGKNEENIFFHPAIANKIEKFAGAVINDVATQDMLRAYDSLLNFWKGSVTAIFPAFHGRNAISNVFLNFMDLGLHALNPIIHMKATQLSFMNKQYNNLLSKSFKQGDEGLKAKDELFDLLNKDIFTDAHGYKWTFGELRQELSHRNVAFGRNLMGNMDFDEAKMALITAKAETKKEALKRGVRRTSPFRLGRQFGTTVEQQARMVNFVANLKATGDVSLAAQRTKQFLFDYQALTPFEKNFMRRLIPFYCVPEDTEALTKKGWKLNKDIKIGDEILTVNTNTQEYEWQPVLELFVAPFNDYITDIKSKRYSLTATLNHRWITEDYKGDISIKRGSELNSGDKIKTSFKYLKNDSKWSVDDAKLLGWLLTDGYFRWMGNCCEAMIYQHPKKFLKEVIEVAGGTPRKPHPDTGVVCVPVEQERIKRIKPLLKRSKDTDSWTDFVGQLGLTELEAMYDAMYKADGTTSKLRTQDYFACEKNGVGETFQMLATLLGKRAIKSTKGYYVSNWNKLGVNSMWKEHYLYKGNVWCPRTENGTWVMRQRGFVTASANTFTRKNLELQVKSLLTVPGRTATQFKAVGTLGDVLSGGELTKEERENLPDWMKSGIAVLKERKGSTLEILQGFGTPIEQPFQALQLNQLLGSVSPILRVPVEQASGYSFFQGKILSDVTNAAAFKSAPTFIQDFIGYTKLSGEKGDGTPFEWHVALRPERMNLLLNLPPTGRVFSAVKQMQAVDVSQQSKIMQQLVGIRPFSIDIEQEAAKRERELLRELEDILNKAGVIAKFERTFIPKENKGF